MSSEVNICNLALAHLGDTATLTSINPPEGSAQAEHCAKFYPIARDAFLEMHDWNFITRRAPLALLSETVSQWSYAYAKPNLMKKVIAVISSEADDDYDSPSPTIYDSGALISAASYVPQPYCIETLSTGEEVICTNQESAVLRYTVSITDAAKFPALFVTALSYFLASMLAGPIIKGDVGAAESKRLLAIALSFAGIGMVKDANQKQSQVTHNVAWISGR